MGGHSRDFIDPRDLRPTLQLASLNRTDSAGDLIFRLQMPTCDSRLGKGRKIPISFKAMQALNRPPRGCCATLVPATEASNQVP
ncbi:hypothetical protein V1281_005147 [Nitrobacteraceae bacterium AZCC 2161]